MVLIHQRHRQTDGQTDGRTTCNRNTALWTKCINLRHITFSVKLLNSRYSKNLGSPWIRPRSLFSENFNGLLFRCTLWMCRPNLKSVALPVPDIIAIGVFGGGCEPQSWGRRDRRPSGMVPFERALVSSYRASIVTFPLSLRVSDILPLLCSSTPLFHPTPSLSQVSHVRLGVGGWPLGYEERRCWANCPCN